MRSIALVTRGTKSTTLGPSTIYQAQTSEGLTT